MGGNGMRMMPRKANSGQQGGPFLEPNFVVSM